jgi:hypothetical protein
MDFRPLFLWSPVSTISDIIKDAIGSPTFHIIPSQKSFKDFFNCGNFASGMPSVLQTA